MVCPRIQGVNAFTPFQLKYQYLRIDLLECLLEDILDLPANCCDRETAQLVERAVYFAAIYKPDWIVEYMLRRAIESMDSKAHERLKAEIEFAMSEFSHQVHPISSLGH